MSDNKNISLQDRGWEHMKDLLDQELPVKKKKRKVIPILFLCGVGLLLLVAVGVVWKSNIAEHSAKDSSPVIAERQKNLHNSEHAVTLTSDQTDNKNHSNLANGTSKNEPADKAPTHTSESLIGDQIEQKSNADNITNVKPQEVRETLQRSINDNFSESESKPNNEAENSTIVSNSNSERPVTTNGVFNVNPSFVSTPGNSIESISTTPRNKLSFEAIQSLRLANVEVISHSKRQRTVGVGQIEIIKPINHFSISPFIQANFNYLVNGEGTGYGLAGGLDLNFEKWSLYSAVGYEQMNYGRKANLDDFSPAGDVFEDDGSNPEGVELGSESFVNSFGLRVEDFSTITKQTRELTFDIGVRKLLTKRLSLDVGMRYINLLQASNKSLKVDVSSPAISQELPNVKVSSTELYDNGAFSSYDFVPHIGLDYRIGKNLHLGVHYNHGLINLISDTNLSYLISINENDAIYRRRASALLRFNF